MDLDLVITQMKIDLTKDFCTGKLIEKNVDVGAVDTSSLP
jgi:hypothetical protein